MKIKPGVSTSQAATISQVAGIITNTKEPNGIVNESEITLSATGSTLNIASSSSLLKFYYQGVYWSIACPTTIAVTETIGNYYVYVNSSYALALMAAAAVPSDDWFATVPLVASCYWNGVELMVSKECHGIVMDARTHEYRHKTEGCRYQIDGGLAGTFTDSGLSITAGAIWDEDLKISIAAKTQCRVYYRSGTTWLRTALQNEYFTKISTDIAYDNAGTLSALGANEYMAMWIFASNDVNAPIIALCGQRKDTTLANARLNNTYESLVLGTLPAPEMKLLYRVIVRNDATPYEETQDYRTSSLVGAAGAPSITHASLAGLANDDHPQYLLKTDYLSTDDVAGIVAANDLSNTYPAITKKDITPDQIAGIAGSASMSASNVAATMADVGVPAGTVIAFADDAAPTGWLECNGAAISRTTYATLYTKIGTTWGVGNNSTTFNIPDFRGEFLRGWDNSKGTDSGRAFASYQAQATNIPYGAWLRKAGTFSVSVGAGSLDSIVDYTSTETRPRNYSVMYCIKY